LNCASAAQFGHAIQLCFARQTHPSGTCPCASATYGAALPKKTHPVGLSNTALDTIFGCYVGQACPTWDWTILSNAMSNNSTTAKEKVYGNRFVNFFQK
jgi:hypothetical protein